MFEASLYSKNPDNSVRCYLCRHNCLIKDGKAGLCMVRENRGGTLYSIFYAKPCSMAVDPIEKKPLFHFYPGSTSFSIATLGCNFQCEFCQNWDISQYRRTLERWNIGTLERWNIGTLERWNVGTLERWNIGTLKAVMPKDIAKAAKDASCKSISYTYSEPTIFYEYARDIAKLAKPLGIENIFVTNGFMTREMLDDAHDWLSAANVDLKAFKDSTYRKIMKGRLNGVLDSIGYMKKLGIWIEVTTLIVPDMNDDEMELKDIAKFIAGVGKEVPWHISRFHPQYKMTDRSATPIEIMHRAYEIGKSAGLKYVYMGNVPGDETENTFCWNCGEKLIERFGFSVGTNKIAKDGKCPKCDATIDGIGLT